MKMVVLSGKLCKSCSSILIIISKPILSTLCVADAQKTGVAQEAVKTATGKLGQMTVQEAQMILGVEKGAPWGEVVKVGISFIWLNVLGTSELVGIISPM
jgi:hypothetical protein